MSEPDYYDILGVPSTASPDDIRRAFRQLALRYHPDVNRSSDAVDKFRAIFAAYQVLIDPVKRAEYDRRRTGPAQTDIPRSPRTPGAGRAGDPSPQARSRSGSSPDVRRAYFRRRIRAVTDPSASWNYYDVLGVRHNASEETIAGAYQRLYREFYRSSKGSPGTVAILREIEEARDVLVDPERRLAYDLLPPDQQPPGRPRMDESFFTGAGRRVSRVRQGPARLLAVAKIPLAAVANLARRVLPV